MLKDTKTLSDKQKKKPLSCLQDNLFRIVFQWPRHIFRRLKIKPCGELALGLSSRLTFAYLCVVVRAIHLTVNMPLQISVAIPRLSGAAEMRGPARGTMPTNICGSVSTVRFARSGRISFRLMAQRLEVSVDNMARESWMYYRHSNSK